MTPFKVWFCYVFGVFIIFLVILLDNTSHGSTFQSFWLGSSRLIYVFGLYIVCMPHLCGSEDLISRIMRNKIFTVISKIWLSSYFMQATVILVKNYRRMTTIHMDSDSIFEGFIASITIVLVSGMVFEIIF